MTIFRSIEATASDRFTAVMAPSSFSEFRRPSLSRFSSSVTRHSRASLPHLIVEVCVHCVQQIRSCDFHWHEHVVVALRVCVFFISTGLSEGVIGVAGPFSDIIITRFFANTFCCISVRFLPLFELGTPGVVSVSDGSPCIPASSSGFALGSSFSSSGTSGASRGRARDSAAGGMSTVIEFGFCGVSTTAGRSSSDQLCSASRRTLRAFPTPSF